MAQWMTVAEAARAVHASEELIRSAISAKDSRRRLAAYIKPAARGSTGTGKRVPYRIHPDDLDDWVRTTWPEVGPNGAA